jgi:hypothetical protein
MIFEKLQKCRVGLQNKKLKKTGKNTYAGFEYFELADFLPTVNEMFLENKLFSSFSMDTDKAYLTITDYEDKTQAQFFTPIAELELKGCNKIQALGGTHTYLKRYLYINALEIIEADLFDRTTGKQEPTTTPKPVTKQKPKDAQIIEALSVCTSVSDVEMVWKKYNAQINNKEEFTQACKKRKEEILKETNNG